MTVWCIYKANAEVRVCALESTSGDGSMICFEMGDSVQCMCWKMEEKRKRGCLVGDARHTTRTRELILFLICFESVPQVILKWVCR